MNKEKYSKILKIALLIITKFNHIHCYRKATPFYIILHFEVKSLEIYSYLKS